MYKAVFQNSKAALAFAAMILFSAVSMVGTSEDAGVVTRAADLVEARRDAVASDAQAFAESRSSGGSSGKVAAPPSVFGEYKPANSTAARTVTVQKPAPGGPPPTGNDLMTAPLAPGAVVLDSGQIGVPVITQSEVTIEPQ